MFAQKIPAAAHIPETRQARYFDPDSYERIVYLFGFGDFFCPSKKTAEIFLNNHEVSEDTEDKSTMCYCFQIP